MSKQDYLNLVRYLKTSKRIIPREHHQPLHDPPEDPDWSIPNTYRDLHNTLKKLYNNFGIEGLAVACLPALERAADFVPIDVDDRIKYAFCLESIPKEEDEIAKLEDEYFKKVCKTHPEYFRLNYTNTLSEIDYNAPWQRDDYTKNQFMAIFKDVQDFSFDSAQMKMGEIAQDMIDDIMLFQHRAMNTPHWGYCCSDFLLSVIYLSDIVTHGFPKEIETSFPSDLASRCVLCALHATYAQLDGSLLFDSEMFDGEDFDDSEISVPDHFFEEWWRDVRCKLAFMPSKME